MSSTLPKSVQADSDNSIPDNGPQDGLSNLPDGDYKTFVQKIKNLPENFLRFPEAQNNSLNIANDRSMSTSRSRAHSMERMIDISVVEAILVKNYGLLRMDLYCKIRVGHMVCETQTCANGAKNPKWDGVYQFDVKPGITTFHVEIYDEKQFSPDEKIAWLNEPIPQEVFQGMTVERWFPLSGRLGPGKEGSILLVLSMKRISVNRNSLAFPINLDGVVRSHTDGGSGVHLSGLPIPVHVQPGQPPAAVAAAAHLQGIEQEPQQPIVPQVTTPITEEDITQLSEMFPSIGKEIIKAVLEKNHGNKEDSITFLLALG